MIDPHDEQIIRPREFLIGGAFVAVVAAFIALILVIHGFSSEGSGSGLPTPSPTPSPIPTGSPTPATLPGGSGSPGNAAEERLIQLARDSIELLPAGRWPELYDQFTSDFQARCTREEFAQAGEAGAEAVGSNLSLLGFVRLDDLVISGDTATGTIVGEVRGQSEYTVDVAYAIEGGVWKLAPATGTSGCSAFNRTSG